jgi:hypothetical protein
VGERIRESAASRALEKGMNAVADFLGFDGRFGWQGPSDHRSFSLFGLGDAFRGALGDADLTVYTPTIGPLPTDWGSVSDIAEMAAIPLLDVASATRVDAREPLYREVQARAAGRESVPVAQQTLDESPAQRLQRLIEERQATLIIADLLGGHLGSDATQIQLDAAASGMALLEEVRQYAAQVDGVQGYVDSYAGGAVGLAGGLRQGTAEGFTAIFNAVTHPIETAQNIWEAGEAVVDYGGQLARGEASITDDASALYAQAKMWEASFELERARIYFNEGNFAAARFTSHEAGRVVGNIFGPGKLADAVSAIRLSRTGGAVQSASAVGRATTYVLGVGQLLKNQALRTEVVRILKSNSTFRLTDAHGLVFAASQAERLGYTFRASLVYNASGHGIDAVFSRTVNGQQRYAVWEAKGGRWAVDPFDLSADSRNMVQLSNDYIATRLQRAFDAAPKGPNAQLIQTLQADLRLGRLDRFASFRASGRTYEIRPHPYDSRGIRWTSSE